jgi:hypothetical protein
MTKKHYRARPYDYRRDGTIGNAVDTPEHGGIFGQRACPANHTGIFESRWALPGYVEQAELTGGPLFPDTLKADVTMSDPVERNIHASDLGPDIAEMYPQPFRSPARVAAEARARARAMATRKVIRRRRPTQLSDDVVTTTSITTDRPLQTLVPLPDEGKPGFFSRPIAGPLVLIGIGVLLAKVIFGGED